MSGENKTAKASGPRAIVPAQILRKWDVIAALQLIEAAPRLAEELEETRARLYDAENCADFWAEQAQDMQLQLCEREGGEPGITQACQLVVVQP